MADIGINFRSTAAYVTDDAGQTYVEDPTVYPVTRDGATFGFSANESVAQYRNRNSGLDPRLAGLVQVSNSFVGAHLEFTIDLDGAGDYDVSIAMGDPSFASGANQYMEVRDTSTVLLTIDVPAGVSSGEFIDASGTTRTSASDWVANQVTETLTFATSTCVLVLAPDTNETGETKIAHFGITPVSSASVAPLAARHLFNQQGQ